jgi:fibronectin-binding autotransporter adhesin
VDDKNQSTNVAYVGNNGGQSLSSNLSIASATDSSPEALSLDATAALAQSAPSLESVPRKSNLMVRAFKRADIILVVLLVLGMGGLLLNSVFNKSERPTAANVTSQYDTQNLQLRDFIAGEQGLNIGASSVVINGSLKVSNGLVVAPSLQPNAPTSGQLYFDQNSKQLAYFNGTQFVAMTQQGAIVQSIGGVSGAITLGGGLGVVGNQLVVNTPASVTSFGGQTGAITVGDGLQMNGSILQNSGVRSLVAGTPNLVVANDGNGNLTVSAIGGGTGSVTSGGGTAGRIAKFTGAQNIEDSLLSESGSQITVGGNLDVTGSLTLGTALSVAEGGTGAISLTTNGVLIGQGASAIAAVTGSAGQCLTVNGSGVPVFGSCAGGGVTSLNALSGALTIANSSGVGSTITIDDATTSSKGIASFNSSNFTVTSGAVNTIQNIGSGSTPTFAGVNTNSITPSGALTVGASSQNLTLQGAAGTTLRATSGGNTTILAFTTPSANTTLNLPALGTGTYDICTSNGNCAGAGVTLQSAYNNSSNPEITVNNTLGGLTIRDAGSAITGNLLEVQNNSGATTYLGVSATGVSVTGTLVGTGNINTSGGALQTNSTTRIDNTGNLTNIGSLTLSGAISGGTTYSGSGNINTTGGGLQTNSTTRIDNSGNIVNIGNITATGAITISSTGGGNNIILNAAGTIELQDNTNLTGNLDVSGTFTAGTTNAFQVAANGDITSAGDAVLQGGTVTVGTSSQAGILLLNDGAGQTGTLQVATLGQPTVYTLPDPGSGSATICLTSGNCAGVGGGVTGTGTNNRLAKFTSTGSTIGDSTITDNGTAVTTTVDLVIQGGDITVGTTSQAASLQLHDGNGDTTTIQAGNSTGSLTFILPTTTGTANQCLKQSGSGNQLIWDACDGGGGGSSATLQNAYANGNSITTTDARDVDIVLADTATDSNLDISVATGSTGSVLITRANGIGTADPAQLLLIDNLDVDRAQPIGIKLQSAGGTLDVGIDASDAEIDDALSIGANNIVGTTGNIDLTNFDVVGSTGDVTTAGDFAVNGGDITSAGGLTITASSGNITLNASGTLELQDNTNITGNLDISGTLTAGTGNTFQVAANGTITTGGSATIQGGVVTAGAAAQAGSLVLYDGSNDTGTLQTAALTNSRTYTFPDATGEVCLNTGNCAGAGVTLQSAYNNSSNPEIVVNDTLDGLTIRDNATPITGNLLEVQDNGGTTNYLAVNTTGASVAGALAATGNINSSGGSLQTNGTSRIDNSGNATNIGNITLSGAISGGTTYSGSGNINTTGGAVQTGGTSRISNSGDLVNIGNLTATAAITIASTGGGNNIIMNSAGTIELQDNTNVTGNLDVSGGLNVGSANALQVTSGGDITTVGNGTIQGGSLTIGTTAQAGSLVIHDGSGDTATLQVATLGQPTTYTLPDPGSGSATICLSSGNCSGGGSTNTLQAAYDAGNTISTSSARNISFTLADSATDSNFTISTATNATGFTTISRADGIGTADPAQLLLIDNLDADRTQPIGLKLQATFGMTTGIDATDGEIGTALSFGANDVVGTTGNIDLTNVDVVGSTGDITTAGDLAVNGGDISSASGLVVTASSGNISFNASGTIELQDNTNLTGNLDVSGTLTAGTGNAFQVSSSGAVTAVGVNAGTGLLQGTGGLTLTGAASLNTTGTANTAIGNATGTFALASSGLNVTTAGALSGVTTLATSGIITAGTLGASDSLTYLCRNSSNQIATCNTTGVGAAFVQGGNTFGAAATLGTNDAFDLNFERGGTTQLTVGNGTVTLASNVDLLLQGANAYISNPQTQSQSEAFGLNATVGGANALAMGYGAIAGQDAVALGQGAVADTSAVSIGRGAGVGGGSFGGPVSIGDGAVADSWGIAIGSGSVAFGNSGTAIGTDASSGQAAVAIGDSAEAFLQSIAIGASAATAGNNQIALGASATTTADNQLVIGGSTSAGSYISNVYIGSGVTDTTPQGFTLQGTGGSGTDVAGASVTIAGGQGTGSGNGGSINFQIANPGSTGSGLNSLATVLSLSGINGAALLQNTTNSATAFQVQDSASAALLTVDTAARSGSGGNRIKVGNSTGTDTDLTLFQLDATTANPTSNLGALNGGLFYNSNTHKVSLIENGQVKIICNTTDLGCGTGTVTLQSAYGNGNSITTTNSRDITFTLDDTATDSNFIVDLLCDTSCGSDGRFAVRDDSSADLLTVLPAGGGITIGNNTINTPLTLNSGTGAIAIGTGAQARTVDIATGAAQQIVTIGSTNAASSITMQGGTGGVNLGTGGIANTIQIGNTTGAVAQSINLGTNGTASSTNTVTVGSTIGTSATTIQAGTGNLSITTQGGTLGVGNNAIAQSIAIGNGTGATAVSVSCGTGACGFGNNAIAHTTTLGSTTGTATTVLQSGTGGTSLTSGANITIGAADTTGTLLVLDTKTSSGDPTGVNGAMYYNSNSRVFRCFQEDTASSGYWRDCMENARTSFHATHEMMSDLGNQDFLKDNQSTGGSEFLSTGAADHPGILELYVTALNDIMFMGSPNYNRAEILLGNNNYWRYESTTRVINSLSTATQRFIYRVGFLDDPSTATDGSDGCFFKYSDNINGGEWQGMCRSGGTGSSCDTNVLVNVSQWYRLTVVVNAAGNSVDFQTDGVSRCQVTSNIPTSAGRETSYGNLINKSVGSGTVRSIEIDYIDIQGQLGTPR